MIAEFLYKIITASVGISLALSLAYAIYIAFALSARYVDFKQKLKGIPVLKGHRLFGGHIQDFGNAQRNWRNLEEAHKKYGKTIAFMYGFQPAMSTIDLDLIKRISIDEAEVHTDRARDFTIPIDEFIEDDIIMSPGDQWRRLRRNIAPAFSSHKLKAPNVQTEMQHTVDKLIGSIETRIKLQEVADGRSETTIDAEDIFHRYVIDLVFRCFYKQPGEVDYLVDRDPWQHSTEAGMRGMAGKVVEWSLIFPAIRRPIQFLLEHFHPQGEARRRILSFIKNQTMLNVAAKKLLHATKDDNNVDADNLELEDGTKFRRNLIDYVIDRFHEGHLTAREYLHSSFTLFLAGNKTLTDGLSKFIYLLAKHPEIQQKLRASLLSEGVESEYLNWCIYEALRLYPPVIIGATRLTGCDVEMDDGRLIPKGTYVFTSAYTVNRLKEYWGPDADEFIPERWANSNHFHPAQYLAFGAGKRKCLGRDFALHGIKLAAVRLLRDYKFEYLSGPNDDMLFEAPFFIFCIFDGPTNLRISRL